jgi:hypothetical protein
MMEQISNSSTRPATPPSAIVLRRTKDSKIQTVPRLRTAGRIATPSVATLEAAPRQIGLRPLL